MLEAQGFPPKNALLDVWDSKAVELWLDRMAGLNVKHEEDDEELIFEN